jgi:hypothetical protein
VNSNKLWMTAQTPSRFCTPISGHTFGVATPANDARTMRTSTALVVRQRAAIAAIQGVVKGDMGLAQSYFPGTTAWRPPTC